MLGEYTKLANGREIVMQSAMLTKRSIDSSALSLTERLMEDAENEAHRQLDDVLKLKLPKEYKVKFDFTPEK